MPSLRPRWGNDPPPPCQGPVWATQGPVWQKRKKTAQPGKQPPAQMENTPAFDLPPGERFPQKISSGERCEKRAGERPGVAHRRPVPGHFARQSRSLRDFSQASISPFSGVGFGALGSRTGSENKNSPVASHFCGCHRRGQRKDEEKYGRKRLETQIRPMDSPLPAGGGRFPVPKGQLRQPQRVHGKGPAVLHRLPHLQPRPGLPRPSDPLHCERHHG